MIMEKGPAMNCGESFGTYLKELRLSANYGLRKFARLIEMPASNLSAIEHDRRPMPAEKLTLAADAIGLEKGSEKWNAFFDLGRQAGELPADVQMVASRSFVPALLRTIDNRQLTDDEIKQLIEDIQQGNGGTQTKSS